MKERRSAGFKDLPIIGSCEEICAIDASSTRFGALLRRILEAVGMIGLKILKGRVRIGSLQQELAVPAKVACRR
jgi:hypothetical protein